MSFKITSAIVYIPFVLHHIFQQDIEYIFSPGTKKAGISDRNNIEYANDGMISRFSDNANCFPDNFKTFQKNAIRAYIGRNSVSLKKQNKDTYSHSGIGVVHYDRLKTYCNMALETATHDVL